MAEDAFQEELVRRVQARIQQLHHDNLDNWLKCPRVVSAEEIQQVLDRFVAEEEAKMRAE